MNKIQTNINEFETFKGGWGLCPFEIFFSIKHIEYKDKLKILEFGSGDGTTNLVNFLKSKDIKYSYTSVEHDKNYAQSPTVNYILYELPINYTDRDLDEIILPLGEVYDLVIVDGPHGNGRAKWYSKFKNYVRPGTIILIDDYHHYREFGEELDKHFLYETINFFNQNKHFTTTNINEGTEIVDIESPFIMDKSYKIIKVKDIKN